MLCSTLGYENSDAGHIKCSRGPKIPHPCFTPMRNPVTQRITVYVSVWQTVGLGPIVGRSALFIGPRNTYCCGPRGM